MAPVLEIELHSIDVASLTGKGVTHDFAKAEIASGSRRKAIEAESYPR